MSTDLLTPVDHVDVEGRRFARERRDGRPSTRTMQLVIAVAFVVWAADRGVTLMFADLRTDENLTGWITSGSLGEAVQRSWDHQGQSPLYFVLLWLWQAIVGSSEVALRLPSLCALYVAARQLASFGGDLGRPLAGKIAVVWLLSVEVGATEARPYIFLVLSLIVSSRFGVSWARAGERRDGIVWILAAAAAVYFQPFAAYALMAHGFIVWSAVRRHGWRAPAGFVALGSVLVLPLVPQLLTLRARQETLVLADLPTVADLAGSLLLIGLWLPMVLLGRNTERPDVRVSGQDASRWSGVPSWSGFVAAWLLLPPLALFAQSHLTGRSVFVERYHLAAFPAAALVIGIALCAQSRRVVLVGCSAIIFMQAILLNPIWSSDWRSAADLIEQTDIATEVWTVSPYVESNHPQYFADDFDADYLNAPLRWQGVQRDLVAIPRLADGPTRVIHDGNIGRLDGQRQAVLLVEAPSFGGDRLQGPLYVEVQLLAQGYVVVDQRVELGVLTTLFEPRSGEGG